MTILAEGGGARLVHRTLFDDLEKRVSGFAIPDGGNFDPTHADDETLRKFGLPPRPNRDREPRRYELWMAMFGRALHFIEFKLSFDRLFGTDYRPFFRRSRVGPPSGLASASRYETSRNRSGAYTEANADKTFVQVWGQWTVPTPAPPTGSGLPDPGNQFDYQCAAWIGLDGERLYRNSSLPQIGTLQEVIVEPDGTQSFKTEAWTQWWCRDDKSTRPVPIPCFPVDHGNIISCLLTVLNSHCVLLNIVNQSCNPPNHAAVRVEAPTVTLENGDELQLSVSGATAEWIMERPTIPDTDLLARFANYDSIDFVSCGAFEASPDDSLLVEQTLKSPRFIRMYEPLSDPPRSRYISMPSRIDDTSFRVTYGDFNN